MAAEKIRLTKTTKASGGAAKIGPKTLAQVLGKLPKFYDENLLVGIETSDDAAVYKIDDRLSMIQTVDFFTPIVDDPFTFGQIAAANALSDVFAMGGEPRVALNIVCFPNCLDPSILGDIMAGGASKVKEAGAVLVGGHSVQDDDPKYGLCVSGFVETDKILRNYGAKPGDVLILTKQIGSGIINTAIKAEMCSEEAEQEACDVMKSLNKKAKEAMEGLCVHACTDITGFGLLGHGIEMAQASQVFVDLYVKKVPVITDALSYAEMGLVPAGSYNNREYTGHLVDRTQVADVYYDLLYDPQSSGGLLFSIPQEQADLAMQRLKEAELDTKTAIIGEVRELGAGEEKRIALID